MSVASAFLLLDPVDNILVCTRTVASGETVVVDEATVILPQAIELGHKIARRHLPVGERVLRYGVPIGTMTVAAEIGAHVHSHNLKSDYIPAHDRNASGTKGSES